MINLYIELIFREIKRILISLIVDFLSNIVSQFLHISEQFLFIIVSLKNIWRFFTMFCFVITAANW